MLYPVLRNWPRVEDLLSAGMYLESLTIGSGKYPLMRGITSSVTDCRSPVSTLITPAEPQISLTFLNQVPYFNYSKTIWNTFKMQLFKRSNFGSHLSSQTNLITCCMLIKHKTSKSGLNKVCFYAAQTPFTQRQRHDWLTSHKCTAIKS